MGGLSSWQCSTQHQGALGGKSLAARLGEGPPGEKYMALETLDVTLKTISAFHSACSESDLESITQQLRSPKAAVAELLSLSRGANRDMKAAITAARKACSTDKNAGQAKGQSGRKDDGAGMGPSLGLPSKSQGMTASLNGAATQCVDGSLLFQFVPDIAAAPLVGTLNEQGKSTAAKVLLIPRANVVKDVPEDPIYQAISLFAAEFETHPIRSEGRGQKPMFPEAAKAFHAGIQRMMPDAVCSTTDMELCTPSCFGFDATGALKQVLSRPPMNGDGLSLLCIELSLQGVRKMVDGGRVL